MFVNVPFLQSALRDLIDRATDPVFCSGAEAELTSMSAAKLGTPDWDQIVRICIEMNIVDAQRAGMMKDALEGLYLSTNQEGGSSQHKGAKERRGASQGVTRREATDFYVRLDAAVKQRHEEQRKRCEIVQNIASQQGDGAARSRELREQVLQARENQQSAGVSGADADGGPDDQPAPQGGHGHNFIRNGRETMYGMCAWCCS